jgi:hypothetical protein
MGSLSIALLYCMRSTDYLGDNRYVRNYCPFAKATGEPALFKRKDFPKTEVVAAE